MVRARVEVGVRVRVSLGLGLEPAAPHVRRSHRLSYARSRCESYQRTCISSYPIRVRAHPGPEPGAAGVTQKPQPSRYSLRHRWTKRPMGA